jgi:hypothetical protein
MTQESPVIHIVNTFFRTGSGMPYNIWRIAKIRLSVVVNDIPRAFSFRQPNRKESLGARLGYTMDAALFELCRFNLF